MQIDLNTIDRENFIVKEVQFAGQKAFLVNPNHIGAKYTPNNLIFRSSVWSEGGGLLSGAWKKFFNSGEKPEIDPLPASLRGARVLEKLDGSLGIFDFVNGVFSSRTRGTANSNQLENAADFNEIKAKYDIEGYLRANPHLSVLCEVTSPRQRIVIDYGDKVEAYLIGAVDKRDYSYLPQSEIDKMAIELGMPRPRRYQFNSTEDIFEHLKTLKGIEGYCLYYNNDQNIRKFKADFYLTLHRLKSEISNQEKLCELYINIGRPSFVEFQKYLNEAFDFEIASMAYGDCSRICDANKTVGAIVEGMQAIVARLVGRPRKDQAIEIVSSYGGEKNNRAGMVFKLLDGKELTSEDYKKLFLQILKK
jgi:hypothetical protein